MNYKPPGPWPLAPGRTKCVLFDLDGTLVDTAPDLGSAANKVRVALGMAPLPLEDYRPSASGGARGLLNKALGITTDHPDFPKHRDNFLQHYGDHIADRSRLFSGVDAMLKALEAKKILWGVATNKPKRYTDALMRHFQFRAACAVSADEVAKPKPSPDVLFTACERLALKPADCVYVGDDKRDIDAGRAAGMKTVAVAWGYEGEHPIAGWKADALIQQPDELLGLFV